MVAQARVFGFSEITGIAAACQAEKIPRIYHLFCAQCATAIIIAVF